MGRESLYWGDFLHVEHLDPDEVRQVLKQYPDPREGREAYLIVNAAREYPPKTSMTGMGLFRKQRWRPLKVKTFTLGLDLTKAPLVPRLALL